jgi:hypothetical protein
MESMSKVLDNSPDAGIMMDNTTMAAGMAASVYGGRADASDVPGLQSSAHLARTHQ